MSDQVSQSDSVKASTVRQLRLLRLKGLADDALLEITSAAESKQFFLMPQTAFGSFARSFSAFTQAPSGTQPETEPSN